MGVERNDEQNQTADHYEINDELCVVMSIALVKNRKMSFCWHFGKSKKYA